MYGRNRHPRGFGRRDRQFADDRAPAEGRWRPRGPLLHASQAQDDPRGHQNAASQEDAKEDAAENRREVAIFRRAARFSVEHCFHALLR